MMDMLLTLFYCLFAICLVYPPTEVVSAGFTVAQLMDNYLGSENIDFVSYHMKRITITALLHSALPLGYVGCLFVGGERGPWLLVGSASTTIVILLMFYKIVLWWEYDSNKHPVVRSLLPFVPTGGDWRILASEVNTEFRHVDKVLIPLSSTSKLIATETWIMKVSQYNVQIIKQGSCTLVATATDNHSLSASGEEEVQYVNIEVIPESDDIKRFSFRITTGALRELQPRLTRPVRVPDHVSLMPPLIERFVTVFKHYVEQNPVHYVDEEPEQCIGCMNTTADVKLSRRCMAPPPPLQQLDGPPPCQDCNCRILWCCSCLARWWAARAQTDAAPERWLQARATCPVCRASFCLLDVCPVSIRSATT